MAHSFVICAEENALVYVIRVETIRDRLSICYATSGVAWMQMQIDPADVSISLHKHAYP